VFGDVLAHKPLHLTTLAAMEVETRAATHLVFEVAELLGRSECSAATAEDDGLLRLLTPVAKACRCVAPDRDFPRMALLGVAAY
jgi:acyl-CoA dehydrogenase